MQLGLKFLTDENRFEDLEAGAENLNETLAQSSTLVTGFDGELRRMQGALATTSRDMSNVEKGLNSGLRRAFDGLIFDGAKLSDALGTIRQSMIKTAYNAAIKPVTNGISGALTNAAQVISTASQTSAKINSMLTRCGTVVTFSLSAS